MGAQRLRTLFEFVETDPILSRLYTGLGFECTDSFPTVLVATASPPALLLLRSKAVV